MFVLNQSWDIFCIPPFFYFLSLSLFSLSPSLSVACWECEVERGVCLRALSVCVLSLFIFLITLFVFICIYTYLYCKICIICIYFFPCEIKCRQCSEKLVLFSPALKVKILSKTEIEPGRLVAVSAEIRKLSFLFVNIYAPNSGADRLQLFVKIKHFLKQQQDGDSVIYPVFLWLSG